MVCCWLICPNNRKEQSPNKDRVWLDDAFLFLCANIVYPTEQLCGKIYNNRDLGFPPINQKLSDIEINGRIDETVSQPLIKIVPLVR